MSNQTEKDTLAMEEWMRRKYDHELPFESSKNAALWGISHGRAEEQGQLQAQLDLYKSFDVTSAKDFKDLREHCEGLQRDNKCLEVALTSQGIDAGYAEEKLRQEIAQLTKERDILKAALEDMSINFFVHIVMKRGHDKHSPLSLRGEKR